MIRNGFIPISDCIYRLRVRDPYKDKILEALLTDRGQNWLQAYAHGVCARSISKSDLLKFRLF